MYGIPKLPIAPEIIAPIFVAGNADANPVAVTLPVTVLSLHL